MKTFFLFVVIIFSVTVSYPQITITASDIQNYFILGTTYTIRQDTLSATASIGSTGNFSIDLSTLPWTLFFNSTAVAPSSTTYWTQFPGATVALLSQVSDPFQLDSYSFYNINTDVYALGIALISTDFSSIIKFLPSDQTTKTPMTFNTSWTTSYTDSSYTTITGFPPILGSSTETVYRVVDGYGTITLPGKTLEVLRIRVDSRSMGQSDYNRSISYEFISKSGDLISIGVADTNAPAFGIVSVDGIAWQSKGTTDIRDDIAGATDYRLLNNYPNPFNPSTKIAYYVPAASKVDISVYNLMGEKVSDVFSGINTQGYQEVTFNAAALSSGTYFYKMNAVSLDGKQTFSSTGKMLLMK